MEEKQGSVGHLDFVGGQEWQVQLWLPLREGQPSAVASLSFPVCKRQS